MYVDRDLSVEDLSMNDLSVDDISVDDISVDISVDRDLSDLSVDDISVRFVHDEKTFPSSKPGGRLVPSGGEGRHHQLVFPGLHALRRARFSLCCHGSRWTAGTSSGT